MEEAPSENPNLPKGQFVHVVEDAIEKDLALQIIQSLAPEK
jgi:hypothetical protein